MVKQYEDILSSIYLLLWKWLDIYFESNRWLDNYEVKEYELKKLIDEKFAALEEKMGYEDIQPYKKDYDKVYKLIEQVKENEKYKSDKDWLDKASKLKIHLRDEGLRYAEDIQQVESSNSVLEELKKDVKELAEKIINPNMLKKQNQKRETDAEEDYPLKFQTEK